MDNALEQLTLQLKKRRLTISVAESCTGGLVAQQLTSLSGSSAYFDCGFIVYNGAAKQRLLGVPANVIENSGEVSRKTVIAMAEGAIKHSAAHLALAITGIAGPSGGTTEKPVGMVWIGWAGKNYETESKVFHFKGDRQSIRQQAADAAMHGMVHYLVKNA